MKKVFVVFAMALVLAGATYVYAVGPGRVRVLVKAAWASGKEPL